MECSFPKLLPEPIAVSELLKRVGERPVRVIGDPHTRIVAVAALEDAEPGCLAFCAETGPRAVEQVVASGASVVVVSADIPEQPDRCFIYVARAMPAFVSALRSFFPVAPSKGIYPTCELGRDLQLGESVEIGAYAVIGDGVRIGAQTRIGCGAWIGGGTVIGECCIIQANCTIGGTGLGVARTGAGGYESFPHLGRVLIEDDVEIGPNSCIVRGILKDTIIGRGSKIANLVNIGHNCAVGENCWISANVVLCGSVVLERDVMIGAAVSVSNHVRIGGEARVGLGSVVTKDVEPGAAVFGVPAKPLATMRPF